MRHQKRIRKNFIAIFLFVLLFLSTKEVSFAQEESSPILCDRALIQGITEESEWEGMVELGLLETEKLDFPDVRDAIDNVKSTAVKLKVDGYGGSGSIFEIEKERIIIVSNKHVLMYDSEVEVTLPMDVVCTGYVIGLSQQYDVGFIEVSLKDIPYMVRKELRKVRLDLEKAENLEYGEEIFILGSADGRARNRNAGVVADPWEYIPQFNTYMIHTYCTGKPGMSGGGTFDSYGNFVGMITGGRGDETVSLPLSIIYEEFISL